MSTKRMAAHEKVPPHRRRVYPIANADTPVINSARAIRGFEATAKTLNTSIVLSDDFARDYGEPFISLGHDLFRELAKPHELFVPAIGNHPARAPS